MDIGTIFEHIRQVRDFSMNFVLYLCFHEKIISSIYLYIDFELKHKSFIFKWHLLIQMHFH